MQLNFSLGKFSATPLANFLRYIAMLKVNCPTCQTQVEWKAENKFKPFCCERCRLIDLGEWASETRVIKGQSHKQEMTAQFDEFADDLPAADEPFFKH